MIGRQGVETSPLASKEEAESLDSSYRLYRAELRKFFSRYSRRSANIEDLVQEVYERLLRYRSRTPIRNPEAYVFQTARNVLRAANRAVRTYEQRYVNCEPMELESRIKDTRSLWIQDDGGIEIAAEELERVLNQLPRPCRAALIRQRRDGWTHQQIATELGVSINTVKDYLGKAFNHFRIHFSLHSADR